METSTNPQGNAECKKPKMDTPVLVQVSKGDNVIHETIGNEAGKDDLEIIRKSMEITQQDLNAYLTKLVEEERKAAPIEQSKDESSDSDQISDDDADQDLDNLIKKIPSKKTR